MNSIKKLLLNQGKTEVVEGVPPLILEKSKSKPLKDYQIYGNSIQAGNKNLLGLPISTITNREVTCNVSSNNVVTFEGVSTGYPMFNFDVVNIQANTDVTISYKVIGDSSKVIFRLRNSRTGEYVDIGNGSTKKTTFVINRIQIALYPNYDYNGFEINDVQLELGKVVTEYEPHIEPTPDNPIKVESVGEKTKNLLDIDVGLNEQLTKEDGIYIITRGESTNRFSQYINVDLKAGVTYTISCDYIDSTPTDNNLVLQFQLTYADGTNNHYWSISKSNTTKVYTLDGDATRLRIYMDGTLPVGSYTKFKNLQIVEGETPTEYEPYGYKIPVISRGKNLFNDDLLLQDANYNTYDKNTGLWTTSSYGSYSRSFLYNAVGASRDRDITKLIKVPKNTTITIRIYDLSAPTPTTLGENNIGYAFFNSNGVIIGKHALSSKDTNTLTTPDEECWLDIRRYYTSGTISFSKIQIEEGTTVTEYEPYVEPIKTNIFLAEPLRKIADYSDYIDFKNNKIVRNIFEYEFQGDEFSTKPFNDLGTTVRAYTKSIIDGSVNNFLGLSEKGVFDGKSTAGGDEERCQYAYVEATKKSTFYARLLKSRCADPTNPTAADFNNVYNKGTKIYGVSATAKEESIELPNIPTHKGTTVLEIDTNINSSNMKAIYRKG